jgi:hypothetical protein
LKRKERGRKTAVFYGTYPEKERKEEVFFGEA